MTPIGEQVRRNAVALISLFIAVTALLYNTWRNEKTEDQRSIRLAAFQVLQNLGELQEIIDDRFYYLPFERDMTREGSSRLRGFGGAAMSRDLMNLMPVPAPAAGTALHAAWVDHFLRLDDVDDAGRHTTEAISAEESLRIAIQGAREAVLQVLTDLD